METIAQQDVKGVRATMENVEEGGDEEE